MSCTPQQRQDWFILRSIELHGNKYSYEQVQYTNARTNVIITCKDHGTFPQLPTHHLKGSGCPKCANNVRLGTTEFVNRSNNIHNYSYTYSKVHYVNNSTNVVITCPIHGDFTQLPCHHLKGSGCPKCAGREHDIIYLWRLGNTSLFKLGISCTTGVKERIKRVSAAHSVNPTQVRIFTVGNAKELENKTLDHFKGYKQDGQLVGEGHTEILDLDDLVYLQVLSYINTHGRNVQDITNKFEG